MVYTDSPLVSYTLFSPFNSGLRTHSIDRITPHCVVGQCSVESLGKVFQDPERDASSNYGIGADGRVGLYVPERYRSWCTGSAANDQRAITIECASDTTEPYAFNNKVYEKLILLCTDICKRNGKNKVVWIENKYDCVNYEPKNGEMQLTVHRYFQATDCPGSWMFSRMRQLADAINKNLNSEPTPTPTPTPTISDEQKIWNYFMGKLRNAYGTAGLMGNLQAESGLRPNNLQNTFEKKLGMTDDQYCEAVNNGTYTKEQFVKDGAGIGLAQWTFWSRKQNLYNYFKYAVHKPLQDLYMQLDFLWQELNTSYPSVVTTLKFATSVRQASDAVLLDFERPSDQSEAVKEQRASYGQVFYDKYSGATPVPPAPTSKYVYNGIDYYPVFNPGYYINRYEDLRKAYKDKPDELFNHFTTFGMKEARQANATFNPVIYRNNYKDLQEAYGNDWPKYYEHYCVFGIKEGRKGV